MEIHVRIYQLSSQIFHIIFEYRSFFCPKKTTKKKTQKKKKKKIVKFENRRIQNAFRSTNKSKFCRGRSPEPPLRGGPPPPLSCSTPSALDLVFAGPLFRTRRRPWSHLMNLEAVRGRIRTNRQMMITAIAVSGTFVLLTFPIGIYLIVRAYIYGADIFYMSNDMDSVIVTIADTFSYFNFAINFFLYSITGKRFRQDLRAACTRKRNSPVVPYVISSLQATQTSYTT